MSSSPLRLSIRGFNTGIPAATAASKYKQELLSIARETNSSPQSATISLLAVITDFPLLNKAFIYSLPGSIPPSTSITKSMESSLKISSKLSVSHPLSISLAFERSDTSTFFMTS